MWRIVLLFLSCLLLHACIESETPLSRPGEFKNDSRLSGTWFTQNKDGTGYIHISSSKKDGWIDIATVAFDDKKGLDVDFCKGFTTPLKNGKFLNVRCRSNLEEELSEKYSEYQILDYDISSENELRLRGWNGNYVQKNIKEGHIKGRKVKYFTTITDSTPNLVKFIEKSDIDRLFKEMTRQSGAEPLYKIEEPPTKNTK